MSTSVSQLRRRPTSPLRTAFVLAGGGNQAVCQVGMLRALFERGIVPDVLVGTSAGACNASVIASMPNLAGVEHLVETWLGTHSSPNTRSAYGADLAVISRW